MQTLTARPTDAPTDRRIPILFAGWALAALAVAAAGVLTVERRTLVPIAFATLLAALVAAYRWWPTMRAFADGVDLRIPIGFHAVRIAFGAGFLMLESKGELNPLFAIRAGWGDVVAGLLAIVAVIAVGTRSPRARAIVLAFNVVGLLDIVIVFATAQYLLFLSGHPETMAAIGRFPLPTIPLFVLPMIFATHFLIFGRLRAQVRDQRLS